MLLKIDVVAAPVGERTFLEDRLEFFGNSRQRLRLNEAPEIEHALCCQFRSACFDQGLGIGPVQIMQRIFIEIEDVVHPGMMFERCCFVNAGLPGCDDMVLSIVHDFVRD